MAAHSSAPNFQENNFAFEIGGTFHFGAGPGLTPLDVFGGAFHFFVLLIGTGGQSEESGKKESSNHIRGWDFDFCAVFWTAYLSKKIVDVYGIVTTLRRANFRDPAGSGELMITRSFPPAREEVLTTPPGDQVRRSSENSVATMTPHADRDRS